MRYLLVLHEALDENLIDEIMLAGVKINRTLFSSDIYIKVICEGSMGLRFNREAIIYQVTLKSTLKSLSHSRTS